MVIRTEQCSQKLAYDLLRRNGEYVSQACIDWTIFGQRKASASPRLSATLRTSLTTWEDGLLHRTCTEFPVSCSVSRLTKTVPMKVAKRCFSAWVYRSFCALNVQMFHRDGRRLETALFMLSYASVTKLGESLHEMMFWCVCLGIYAP